MSSVPTKSLNWFQTSRLTLIGALNELESLGLDDGRKQLQEKAERLRLKLQSFHFNLVLLGEFKRGKSTLVNALIGAPVLPTATIPLTSVTTIVRYGKSPKLFVHFDSGQTLELPVAEIEKYVTERSNPGNKLQVTTVELEYPTAIFQKGVRIVDTPGIGSVHLHNTEVTYKFLPEADAAILLFAADQPASKNEIDFLHEACKFAKRMFFVQNKIDYLDDAGRAESLSFLQETLEKALGEQSMIYQLSARQAVEAKLSGDPIKLEASGFKTFEDDLIGFLTNQRAITFIKSVAARIRGLALESEQLAQLEQQVAAAPVERLENCLVKFQQVAAEILAQQSDADHIVRGEVARLIKTLEEDLKPVIADHAIALVQNVEAAYERHKNLNKDDLVEVLIRNLKEQIERIFGEWRLTEDAKVKESFDRITGRFVNRANQVIDEIKKVTLELFALEVTAHFELEPLTDKSRLYFAVDNPFNLSLQSMPLLLPDLIAKTVIRSRFLDCAKEELSRNAGRLRADYQERIESSARKFLASFHAQIAETLEQIESVLQTAIERRKEGVVNSAAADEKLALKLSAIRHVSAITQEDELGRVSCP